jgi:futalosine hydrolase
MSDKAKKYLVANMTAPVFPCKSLLLYQIMIMQILIVSATVTEIRPFLDKLPVLARPSEQLTRYQYKDVNIDVLIPGIGMVPTAYYLGRQLAVQHYDFAVNAGIAGTFNKSLPLGSVVNVVEDCIPELGAEDGDNFLSVFDLGLADPDTYPFRGGWLYSDPAKIISLLKQERISKLPQVKGITSNTVRGNIDSIARIRKMAMADLESMEGAAFLYGCLADNVPCIQVRAISNRVEERDRSTWKLDLALKNLNRLLLDTLNDIY